MGDQLIVMMGYPKNLLLTGRKAKYIEQISQGTLDLRRVESITSYKRIMVNGLIYHSETWSNKFTRYCFQSFSIISNRFQSSPITSNYPEPRSIILNRYQPHLSFQIIPYRSKSNPIVSWHFHPILITLNLTLSSASNFVIVKGETRRFCSIEEIVLVKRRTAFPDEFTFNCYAQVCFYPKESDTRYWRVLYPLSAQRHLVNPFDFEGRFLLFPGDGARQLIGVPL